MDNTELSYRAHTINLESKINEKDERLFHIINKNCIGYQTINQTLSIIEPFLGNKKTWLTIGDYNGLEANFLENRHQETIASDISDVFLNEAFKQGLIKKYSVVNVEKIHFPDDTFDYTFCKEAFHHFPKAYIGLYEMIRCSKDAVIIIEPIDIITKMPVLLFIKNMTDRISPKLINKIWRNRYSFEIVGNYVFKISEREIEKIAMGMGLCSIAFKKINIIVDLNMDKSFVHEVPMNKKYWKKLQNRLKFINMLSYLHIIPYNHLCCVLFKKSPDERVIEGMKILGYTYIELPKNPYTAKIIENSIS
jgi:ubiquinone/menaquinone biosynthesis C-methylase UbiE